MSPRGPRDEKMALSVPDYPSQVEDDMLRDRPSLSNFCHEIDPRVERKRRGSVKYRVERSTPDFGATGWRTRTGTMLKNQQYYRSFKRFNLWNDPIHAGRDTWKCYHGPRLRTDSGLMEQRDKKDKRDIDWIHRKQFVTETRENTLERYYARKIVNKNMERSSSWAHMQRAQREVNEFADTFDGDLNALPQSAVKKVITPLVLQGDVEAVKFITAKYEKEAYYRKMWKQWEQHRQYDIRQDFKRRRVYNEELQELAKQPVRTQSSSPYRITEPERYSSKRILELANPKEEKTAEQTLKIDFRGLVTVDSKLALDTLFKGAAGFTKNFGISAKPKTTFDTPIASAFGPNPVKTREDIVAEKTMQEPRYGAYTFPLEVPTNEMTRQETRRRLDRLASEPQPHSVAMMRQFVAESALFKEEIRSPKRSPKRNIRKSKSKESIGFASLAEGFREITNTVALNDDIASFEERSLPQRISHTGNFFMSEAIPVRGQGVEVEEDPVQWEREEDPVHWEIADNGSE